MLKKIMASVEAMAEHRYFQVVNRCISYITHLLGIMCIALLTAFFLPVLSGVKWGSPEHASAMLGLTAIFLGMLVIILAVVYIHKRLSKFRDR
jgi:hypothetical protein